MSKFPWNILISMFLVIFKGPRNDLRIPPSDKAGFSPHLSCALWKTTTTTKTTKKILKGDVLML